jgi:hypothetical protein
VQDSDAPVFYVYDNDLLALQALEVCKKYTSNCEVLPAGTSVPGGILLFGSAGNFSSSFLAQKEEQFTTRLIVLPKGHETAEKRVALRKPSMEVWDAERLPDFETALRSVFFPTTPARVSPQEAERRRLEGIRRAKARRRENYPFIGR